MLAESRPSPPQPPLLPPVLKPTVVPVTTASVSLYTPSGERLVTGRARLRVADTGWSATISAIDRPGVIARAYFTAGLRDVVLELPGGRRSPAKITQTSFSRASQRTYELSGIGAFA